MGSWVAGRGRIRGRDLRRGLENLEGKKEKGFRFGFRVLGRERFWGCILEREREGERDSFYQKKGNRKIEIG